VIFVRKDLPQTTFVWAAPAPTVEDRDRAPLEVADFALGGGGFQSRLVRQIREERGLAYGVDSFYSPMKEMGILGVSGATRTEAMGEVFSLVEENVARLGREGVSAEELAGAREALSLRRAFLYRDPASAVQERIGLHLSELPEDLTQRFFTALAAVTAPEVRDAAGRNYRVPSGVWVLVGRTRPENGPWQGRPIIEAPPSGK
jgi:zinc protease